jgi:hypothetical protein
MFDNHKYYVLHIDKDLKVYIADVGTGSDDWYAMMASITPACFSENFRKMKMTLNRKGYKDDAQHMVVISKITYDGFYASVPENTVIDEALARDLTDYAKMI